MAVLEAAGARAAGAGVGAGFGAEQLRLDQLRGNRAAVDRDERAAANRGIRMHDLRDALLAGAVRPGDQHPHIGARHPAGQLHHALHRVGGEHDAAQVVLLRQTLAPAALLLLQPLTLARRLRQFQQVLDRRQQLVVVPGLADVIGGAGLDELHRGFQMRPGRQQNHRQIRLLRAQGAEQRRPLLARGGVGAEVHVCDHEIDALARQQRQALCRGVEAASVRMSCRPNSSLSAWPRPGCRR